jgi:hypothetical protein
MSEKRHCNVYKSPREADMYLYVDRREDLERVPAPLLERFGIPQPVMTLELTPDRKLARARAGQVLDAIREQGFYLQLPPSRQGLDDEAMAAISAKNRKLRQ